MYRKTVTKNQIKCDFAQSGEILHGWLPHQPS